jgi:hypothetical protein
MVIANPRMVKKIKTARVLGFFCASAAAVVVGRVGVEGIRFIGVRAECGGDAVTRETLFALSRRASRYVGSGSSGNGASSLRITDKGTDSSSGDVQRPGACKETIQRRVQKGYLDMITQELATDVNFVQQSTSSSGLRWRWSRDYL